MLFVWIKSYSLFCNEYIILYTRKSILYTLYYTTTTTKSLQSCLTLWDPRDGSPPASPVPGILQARTLEWVAISFSNAWKWKVKVKSLSRVWLLATPWTAAYQAPLSMGFSRQEYWSGVPLPSPTLYCTLYFLLENLHGTFSVSGHIDPNDFFKIICSVNEYTINCEHYFML